MNYNELVKSTALLKAAYKFIDNDADDCIDTFKAELKEAIEDNEKEMQDFDDWVDQKAEEAKYDVD